MALTDLTEENMRTLIESFADLTSEIDLDHLLIKILKKAGELTDSPDASVILKHVDRPGLYFAAATGDGSESVLSVFGKHSAKEIPVSGSKAGSVFQTSIPIIENKIEDHFPGVDKESKKITKSMVCVPLTVGSRKLGVMQILNKRSGPYLESDQELLRQFSHQAAVAIRNAQMFEDLLAHSGFYSKFSGGKQLEELVDELQKPAEERWLTILFADMRGFTQLLQYLGSPATAQAFLNEFVSMLTEEILIQDGIVNKFLGDGVMALFRSDKHSESAVRAAVNMVEKFGSMKESWNDQSAQQLDFLGIGIGIVTDRVTLGAIGSDKVRDFTAIGNAVNLAAMFEQHARNGKKILMNHFAYKEVENLVVAESEKDMYLTKVDQSIEVPYKCYHLRGLKPIINELIFISYSSEDRKVVQERIAEPLENLGVKIWMAGETKGGANWAREIRDALRKARWMIVCVSKHSKESTWVAREVDIAEALGTFSDRIIPITTDKTLPGQVSEFLAPKQSIDLRKEPDVAEVIVELMDGTSDD